MLELRAGDLEVTVAPAIGGSLRSFTKCGEPVMRTAAGPTILDAACFVLVPYSNRIAHGRFFWDGRHVQLAPNKLDVSTQHPLHGSGWTSQWHVVAAGSTWCELQHVYPGGDWPWPFTARQRITVNEASLTMSLSVENRGETDMPAGLGFHPYFTRAADTRLHALHRGEWLNDSSGIPQELASADAPRDWTQGRPIGEQPVDTVYAERAGDMTISWPQRRITATIHCDSLLAHTAIFVPQDVDWFCVEPVTHMTDALNRPGAAQAMIRLAPGQTAAVAMTISVMRELEDPVETGSGRKG